MKLELNKRSKKALDSMTEGDMILLLGLAKRFHQDREDVATPEDVQAIQEAMEEYANGETISGDDIDWD